MVIRPYDDGIINEFDSLDELRVFDPAFIKCNSDIFDNIVQILGCSKSEIHDVYPLKRGLQIFPAISRQTPVSMCIVIQAWELNC